MSSLVYFNYRVDEYSMVVGINSYFRKIAGLDSYYEKDSFNKVHYFVEPDTNVLTVAVLQLWYLRKQSWAYFIITKTFSFVGVTNVAWYNPYLMGH